MMQTLSALIVGFLGGVSSVLIQKSPCEAGASSLSAVRASIGVRSIEVGQRVLEKAWRWAGRQSRMGTRVAADYVQTEAPRLIKVAGVTAISFGLWDGANRALRLANQEDVHDDAWQIALGYRGDTISLTVVRLALLQASIPMGLCI